MFGEHTLDEYKVIVDGLYCIDADRFISMLDTNGEWACFRDCNNRDGLKEMRARLNLVNAQLNRSGC